VYCKSEMKDKDVEGMLKKNGKEVEGGKEG
jgi:hypothetical protein